MAHATKGNSLYIVVPNISANFLLPSEDEINTAHLRLRFLPKNPR